jgi:hypothetical protein
MEKAGDATRSGLFPLQQIAAGRRVFLPALPRVHPPWRVSRRSHLSLTECLPLRFPPRGAR